MPSFQLNTPNLDLSSETNHQNQISMGVSTCQQILGPDALQFFSNTIFPSTNTNNGKYQNISSQNKKSFNETESSSWTSDDSNLIKNFFLSVQLLAQIEQNQKTIDSLFEFQTKIKLAKQYLCSMGISMD